MGFCRRIRDMLASRSMPRNTVAPKFAYPNTGETVDRLCEGFRFTVRIRMGDHRAQLNVGDASVILIEPDANVSLKSSVMVRVEDVDTHYEHARRSGVKILRPPTDYPYGERQYNVEDFAGHHWCFSQSIADVDPRAWGGTPGRLCPKITEGRRRTPPPAAAYPQRATHPNLSTQVVKGRAKIVWQDLRRRYIPVLGDDSDRVPSSLASGRQRSNC